MLTSGESQRVYSEEEYPLMTGMHPSRRRKEQAGEFCRTDVEYGIQVFVFLDGPLVQ